MCSRLIPLYQSFTSSIVPKYIPVLIIYLLFWPPTITVQSRWQRLFLFKCFSFQLGRVDCLDEASCDWLSMYTSHVSDEMWYIHFIYWCNPSRSMFTSRHILFVNLHVIGSCWSSFTTFLFWTGGPRQIYNIICSFAYTKVNLIISNIFYKTIKYISAAVNVGSLLTAPKKEHFLCLIPKLSPKIWKTWLFSFWVHWRCFQHITGICQ